MNKEELIQLKTATVDALRSVDINSYQLDKADIRLNTYIAGCIGNPEAHNLYELLAIRRFFYLLDKYDFRPGKVRRFIVFYEKLKFSGTKGLTRYKLTPVQVFQFANILGFYRPGTNKRLIRDALLFVPRKFSKTTSIASLAVFDLLFGDANAQAYVAANSYNQAVIVDEYSQADSAALKNVLTSSMGARLNPLTIVITTASDKHTTPFTEMLSIYKAILRGEAENDSIFAHIFEPDIDDEEGDPATWYKVQPHMGITVYEDFYKDAYQKALYSAPDALEFRTKLLNIFAVNSETKWIEAREIEERYKAIPVDKITSHPPTMVGVDLSVRDDFSTVTYNIYSPDTKSFHSVTDYYFPEGALPGHPNRELYEGWVKAGYLKLCPGEVIDYEMIVNDILARAKYLKILGIGYDPYKSAEFVNLLSASVGYANDYISPVKQTYGTFTSPIESFELALHRNKITFDPNPITPYCFGNAVLDEDRNMNKKPIKKTHNAKIDSTITNLMTFYLFNNMEV